jgi:hypothetical protein
MDADGRTFAALECEGATGDEGWLSDRVRSMEGRDVGLMLQHFAERDVWLVEGAALREDGGLRARERVIPLDEILARAAGAGSVESSPESSEDRPPSDDGLPLPPDESDPMLPPRD